MKNKEKYKQRKKKKVANEYTDIEGVHTMDILFLDQK